MLHWELESLVLVTVSSIQAAKCDPSSKFNICLWYSCSTDFCNGRMSYMVWNLFIFEIDSSFCCFLGFNDNFCYCELAQWIKKQHFHCIWQGSSFSIESYCYSAIVARVTRKALRCLLDFLTWPNNSGVYIKFRSKVKTKPGNLKFKK